jgi:hypothetical protein
LIVRIPKENIKKKVSEESYFLFPGQDRRSPFHGLAGPQGGETENRMDSSFFSLFSLYWPEYI